MKSNALLFSVLALASVVSPAWGAPVIVTPGLTASDGALCRVVNASGKKDVTVDIRIYDFKADVVAEKLGVAIPPHDTESHSAGSVDLPRHCEVVVVSGGRRNVRGTFEDASRAVVGY